MAQNDKNDGSGWVDQKMSALDAGGDWQPNSALAWARLQARDRGFRPARRWLWGASAVSAAGLALLAMPAQRFLAERVRPVAATRQVAKLPFPLPPEPVVAPSVAPAGAELPALSAAARSAPAPVATAHAVPAAASAPVPAEAAPVRAEMPEFKVSGAASAAVRCELYLDYQCPPCARVFREVIPLLIAEYVDTGKVKLVRRDFPLAVHRYARLAARYANAAGHVGQYDTVVDQLFKTQSLWGASGDIAGQVALVLPDGAMREVSGMVANYAWLDENIADDVAMGVTDRVTSTPSLVIESKDARRTFSPMPSYGELKAYLDRVLAQ